jgi:DNA-directed RNA polymerase specialized sigma subunit
MSEQSKPNYFDNSLYILADELTRAIGNNEDGSDQKKQVEKLMALEKSFKNSILKFKQANEIYRKFILLVVVQNRNILSARPFFREKADIFSSQITPAIKDGKIRVLQKFHINYLLIKFVRDNWVGPFPEKSQKFFDQVVEARRRLIENNMPLAINRAKLFYRKVPRNHVSLMDMIGIAAMGLISGVDKWVGDYSPVFRSVCIGRMAGNLIESYSETMLHFYPSDRHVLYRANSIAYRQDIQDFNELAEAINKSFVQDKEEGKKTNFKKINGSELASLMKAASTMSTTLPGQEGETPAEVYEMQDLNSEVDMENDIVQRDSMNHMISSALGLPLMHQKVLRLKGIKI